MDKDNILQSQLNKSQAIRPSSRLTTKFYNLYKTLIKFDKKTGHIV
jgi:hypothetical protein